VSILHSLKIMKAMSILKSVYEVRLCRTYDLFF